MENIAHDIWSSAGWRAEAQGWVAAVLAEQGELITGPLEQPRTRPWSTQLTVPTSLGRLWFKVNAPGSAYEAALVGLLAELVPEQVVVPVAVEAHRGWLLSRDAGPTLATLEQTDEATWVRVLQEYGALQRRLVDDAARVVATGVPVLAPPEAGAWLGAYADELAALQVGDPCRIGPDDRVAVAAQLGRLDRAAAELAAGPVPLSLEHNDLHTDNVFVPVAGSRLRFFDFGDSLWAHPFTSVWLALRVLVDTWQVPTTDPRLATLVDAYLEVWNDLAPLAELRTLCHTAGAFGPVHRVHAWVRCLSTTEARYWPADLVTAGHDWLLELAHAGS